MDDNDVHIVASHYKTKRLKHIGFENMELSAEMNQTHLKDILENVETIQFKNCYFKNDIGVSFLRHCHRLKYLDLSDYVIRSSLINLSDTKHQWMQEKYPKLEFLRYDVSKPTTNMWPMIRTFFEQNPNVQMFYPLCEAASSPIEVILDQMKSNEIRVKKLCLKMGQISFSEIDQIYRDLITMQEQNYFSELHLDITRSEPLTKHNCAMTLGSMNNIHGLYANFTIADFRKVTYYIYHMISLKSLLIFIPEKKHAKDLARKLINLEEIFIRSGNLIVITPFVRYSTKLHTLYLFGLADNFGCINIQNFNDSRKKLSGAGKLTIYVRPEFYENQKKYFPNTNMDLIEIKMYDFPSLKNAVARFHIMNNNY